MDLKLLIGLPGGAPLLRHHLTCSIALQYMRFFYNSILINTLTIINIHHIVQTALAMPFSLNTGLSCINLLHDQGFAVQYPGFLNFT